MLPAVMLNSTNPIAAAAKREAEAGRRRGLDEDAAARQSTLRIFSAKPGAYGAGLQALIDEKLWQDRSDFAEAFLVWSGHAYGENAEGIEARGALETRLAASDAVVHNQDKDMAASLCSTGEQKALLIAIVLAHAHLLVLSRAAAPILLLDEVAAHLDADRRAALAERIIALGAQAWLTGTDRQLFEAFGAHAQIFEVNAGTAVPIKGDSP